MTRIIQSLFALTLVAFATQTTAANVTFDDLTLGTTYTPGDVFTSDGTDITVRDFVFSDGSPFAGGFTEVENGGLAGGSGQEMEVNNVNLAFGFAPATSLMMNFGEFGGNLNLTINGVFSNFSNFADLDGMTIAGVDVSVTNGFGSDRGVLALSGLVNEFIVGGQELWIDDVVTVPSAVPLPASSLLLIGGLAGIGALRRKS